MSEDFDAGVDGTAPTWAVFGDLMSVLLGSFVLILVSVIGMQLELSTQLEDEVKQRQEETHRRESLEQVLAGPLAAGRVTLVNGRIGISGSVLFALNSDQLQPEGRELLRSLAEPLTAYLGTRQEILMVSGFTDDQQVREGNRFADNWDLSAQRADRDPHPDRRRRAVLVPVRRGLRLGAAGGLERRRRGPGQEPPRGNRAGAAPGRRPGQETE